jgi:hypothetical protein
MNVFVFVIFGGAVCQEACEGGDLSDFQKIWEKLLTAPSKVERLMCEVEFWEVLEKGTKVFLRWLLSDHRLTAG